MSVCRTRHARGHLDDVFDAAVAPAGTGIAPLPPIPMIPSYSARRYCPSRYIRSAPSRARSRAPRRPGSAPDGDAPGRRATARGPCRTRTRARRAQPGRRGTARGETLRTRYRRGCRVESARRRSCDRAERAAVGRRRFAGGGARSCTHRMSPA